MVNPEIIPASEVKFFHGEGCPTGMGLTDIRNEDPDLRQAIDDFLLGCSVIQAYDGVVFGAQIRKKRCHSDEEFRTATEEFIPRYLTECYAGGRSVPSTLPLSPWFAVGVRAFLDASRQLTS